MKIYETKQFWYVVGGLAVIVVLAMIFLSKPQAAQEGTVQLKDAQTGQTIAFNPRPYTDALLEMIDSYFFATADRKPLEDLYALPDAQFISVAQDWNNRYKKRTHLLMSYDETLLEALRNEYHGSGAQGNELWLKVEQRFKQLNIS